MSNDETTGVGDSRASSAVSLWKAWLNQGHAPPRAPQFERFMCIKLSLNDEAISPFYSSDVVN